MNYSESHMNKMTQTDISIVNKSESLIQALTERAKELNCLYLIEELLNNAENTVEEILWKAVDVIPQGFQHSEYCMVRIICLGKIYQPANFIETPWVQISHIKVKDESIGTIYIYYSENAKINDEPPFLKEELKLLNTIADRIGHFILHQRLKRVFSELQNQQSESYEKPKPEWSVILSMLRRTDQHLFSIISRKMINHLFCKGIKESKEIFRKLGTNLEDNQAAFSEINRPSKKQVLENSFNLGFEIFDIAAKYFSGDELLNHIQKWIHEEKSHFLVKALANLNTPLSEISDAIRRYYHMNPVKEVIASPVTKGIRVSLIRRFLTDQLQFINIAKEFSEVSDFYELMQNMIFPAESHGKVGGKSAGLFLARKVIEKISPTNELLSTVKTPKTWYITSDATYNFIYYNNLEDIIEQKYKDIDEIRQEYPHIIQAFKNSHFSPEITNGLSRALDDFGRNPIIVRSSSLLEDRMGSAFAGKYKSLFLANQGSKPERLEALMDAIAEVYASIFGPDPIGYRIERGLLDFHEEMGIMIQEVVGKKLGKYFFPAFAGVAFSVNEFRWSPRIKRDDGLIRMVPGLGTRAVDRVADDYPILIAPGQPNLRVNLSFDEIVNYSPKNIDVINLETNTFETVPISELMKEVGNNYPMLNEIFSIQQEYDLRTPVGLGIDTAQHKIVVTFENLITHNPIIKQLHSILKVVHDSLKTPVDIEFACDGDNLYLLQCRPQSSAAESASAMIPKNIPNERILFTANKFVSNGKIPDINYVVYVDPENYSKQSELKTMIEIGKAVGMLNQLLPKKSFILMGPGRWGSRDDIRLGVKVTYSDINNTAMLVEIARAKGNYIPDLSFGTHFFQDLVEASIRYLPLYPDESKSIFNHEFLLNSENILTRFLPDFEHLQNTVKVINVRESTKGLVLRVLMNADEDDALAFFDSPLAKVHLDASTSLNIDSMYNEALQWRIRMAESIAAKLDSKRFGVLGIYLFGTVFNETAGANSDIDLIVRFEGTPEQRRELELWLEGWNNCLSQINYNKSGYLIERLLDVTILTAADLEEKNYFAEIINPANNNSRRLDKNSVRK